MVHVELLTAPINVEKAISGLVARNCGAVVTFQGTVRDNARGRRVLRLEYSAYEEMARSQLKELAEEAGKQFDLERVVVIHHLGTMEIGETSVFIGVAAPHRVEAFTACRFIIDSMKERVPIWKKEYYEDGETWIEGDDRNQAL